MQKTYFSKCLIFKPCLFVVNYRIEPDFKIISAKLQSLLNRKNLNFKESYIPNNRLDKILSSISSYFDENTPVCINLEDLDLQNIPAFFRNVLKTLLKEAPFGKVITYKRLAELTGKPNASRAVGTAMSSNPFPLLVPCHRVIKSDLSIGNYGPGQNLKLLLLKKETPENSFKNRSLINEKILI